MPAKCCVRGCTLVGGHRFPRDVVKKKEWLKAIRRKNYNPSKHAIVCKKHFTPEDFTLPKDSVFDNPTPILKKNAVPSLFNWDNLRNDTVDMIGATTNQDVPVRIKPETNNNPVLKAGMEATGLALPVREKLVHATPNSGVKAGVVSRQPIPKLRRVPNNPSLIARLEAARKATSVRPNLTSTACMSLQAGSNANTQAKLLRPSFNCIANPDLTMELKLTQQAQATRQKLEVLPKVGYQMDHHPPIRTGPNPYDIPSNIREVQVEKEFDMQGNENLTHFTANPAVEVNSTTFVEHIMCEEYIKKENGNFVAVEIGCVEVEFDRKFKDKEIQCNIGDPCCSIFLYRKQPSSNQEEGGNSSLSNNLKKRRTSI